MSHSLILKLNLGILLNFESQKKLSWPFEAESVTCSNGRQPRYVFLRHGIHDLSDPTPVVVLVYCSAVVSNILVLSPFFRWQVGCVNLPKIGLDCPPDWTRLLKSSQD